MTDYVNSIKEKILGMSTGKAFKKLLNSSEIQFIENYTKDIKNVSFTTKIFYTINQISNYIKCYKCGADVIKNINPIIYNKNGSKDLNLNINTFLCDCCNPNHTCKQSYVTRYKKFASREKDPYLKSRILTVGENFYNDEYINNWAINFKNINDRRPTKEDFKLFFGRKFPRKSLNRQFDKTLFDLWDSYLELKVCDYIKSLGYNEQYIKNICKEPMDFVRNSMFNYDNKWYQIDIYFPYFNLGFEIQDFETHDKNSDTQIYRQRVGEYKHGPSYHNAKKIAASRVGIIIVEIWEDDIRNESYKEIINKCLNQII